MIEGLPDVPPALLLLKQELSLCKSLEEMRRRIKGMLRDLREQSETFEVESVERPSYSKATGRFEIHLHGAMDLLSEKGCIDPNCRTLAADRIARSVGLIADRVWLTDLLSGQFLDFGKPTNEKLDRVIIDVIVLSRLFPLIRAGVVRFRSPWALTCSSCADNFSNCVDVAAERIAGIFSSEFRIEKRPGGYYVDTGKCLEPKLIFNGFLPKSKRTPTVSKFARRWISEELRSTLWVAREASLTGGAIFSNSRVGLAGLLQHDGRLHDMNSLLLLDKERDFSVPWVSELDASQIVQLREEASSALPAFREKMFKAMSVDDNEIVSSVASKTIISDLREQAAEVRAELEVKRKNSARYWKVTYGILGLGLSAYGVATDQLIPGVGGLLPVIHLLVNHKTGHETDVSKLMSKPGFVLIKAQDILSHANEQS